LIDEARSLEDSDMADPLTQFSLGAATITIINVDDIRAPLTTWMDPPPGGWPEGVAAIVSKPEIFPVNCVHIKLPSASVLVDAGAYDTAPDLEDAVPGYEPPEDLPAALAGIGVSPQAITHLVITHTHGDHFNGTTRQQAGAWEPTFPNARTYIGRADWEQQALQNAVAVPDSLASRTLAVLHRAGLLEPVTGDLTIADGVQIIAAPGETPGHQIVRVQSEGRTLYCVGDLFHHQLEVERPELMVRWSEPRTTLASRKALIERALAEDARIVATHIPGVGRLRRTGDRIGWEAA
jgi:glyoxylase-like metal-dependent hydrolase (beta-lactamase superfamily II)